MLWTRCFLVPPFIRFQKWDRSSTRARILWTRRTSRAEAAVRGRGLSTSTPLILEAASTSSSNTTRPQEVCGLGTDSSGRLHPRWCSFKTSDFSSSSIWTFLWIQRKTLGNLKVVVTGNWSTLCHFWIVYRQVCLLGFFFSQMWHFGVSSFYLRTLRSFQRNDEVQTWNFWRLKSCGWNCRCSFLL